MNTPSGLGRPLRFAAVAFTFVIALLAHYQYVKAYGVEIPVWDQWGAEGYFLLKPWAEGQMSWGGLVAPWNEHRIVFTRLLALALYRLSDSSWAILRMEYVNAAVYAAIPALLIILIGRGASERGQKVVLGSIVVVLALLPYAWENTLGGFQNQFYFMTLTAIGGIGVSASTRLRAAGFGTLLILAIASVFTMAPGIVAAPAMVVVLISRGWLGQLAWKRVAPSSVALIATAVIGYAATPVLPHHAAMRPLDIQEFLHALIITTGWPTTSPRVGTIVLWIPTVVASWMIFRRRWNGTLDVLMLGIAAWTVAQILGIAFSRGHELDAVTPRYTDILAMGLIANSWFAIRVAASPSTLLISGLIKRAPVALLLLVVAQGFITSTPEDLGAMAQRRDQLLMQRTHIQAYLRNGVASQLDQPAFAIGLPDPAALRQILSDPTMRHMLRTTQGPFPAMPASNAQESAH